MSLQPELVLLVGGGSINMSRRWRWETLRLNNIKQSMRGTFGWADVSEANLRNKEGLPTSPLRADSVPR